MSNTSRILLSSRTRKQLKFDLLRLKARLHQRQRKQIVPPYPRLHFGCGSRRIPNWLNVDVTDSDFDIDLATGTLPWRSNVFQAIISQQVVEHLELQSELLPLLKELRRVATDDAELWLACPDMEKVCRAYIEDRGQALIQDRQTRWSSFSMDGLPSQHIINVLFHQGGEHKNLYDFELLQWALEKSGFEAVTRVTEHDFLARFPEFPSRNDDFVSLYVMARTTTSIATHAQRNHISSELITCPSCNSAIYAQPIETHHYAGTSYELQRCPSCHLHFWTPPLPPDSDFYHDEVEEQNEAVRVRHTIGTRRLRQSQELFFKRYPRGNGRTLLDLGCGDGLFLAEAQKRGYVVCGMDFDSKALAVARRRGLSDLHDTSLDEFVVADGRQFDFVTFFEVLEHQPDPAEFENIVRALAKPNAIIAGSVPNRERFKWFLDQDNDKPPYHYTRWDRFTIDAYLRQIGLSDSYVEVVDHGFYALLLMNGINLAAKRRLMPQLDQSSLSIYTVEELSTAKNVDQSRMRLVKQLKRVKAMVTWPIKQGEIVVSKACDNGQTLYFEGRYQ